MVAGREASLCPEHARALKMGHVGSEWRFWQEMCEDNQLMLGKGELMFRAGKWESESGSTLTESLEDQKNVHN